MTFDLERISVADLADLAIVDGPGSEADCALQALEDHQGLAAAFIRPDDSLIVLGALDLILLAEDPVN